MKKFLSLVLALIMTMSLVTIGAGATEYRDLTDKDEIQYEEAVAVLNRIGVITGYEDGSFRPETELTRGAAAKIIVSLLIGPEAASNLPNATAPYPDVPASHTFAGVISYCKTAGIISGYGDGTFKPANSLTGFAFAKMLLGALGYKSEIEGFVDTGWTMNVARIGNVTGLFDRLDFDGSAAVNREEACQLALNTLKATMVTYGGTTLVTGAQALAVQGTQAMYVTSNNREINANINRRVISATNNEMTLEFGEEHFKDLRLEHDKYDPAYDEYGHPSDEWSWKKVTIGTFPLPADFTFTKQMAHLEDTAATKEKALGLRNYDTYSLDHRNFTANWNTASSNDRWNSPFADATQIHINGWKARVNDVGRIVDYEATDLNSGATLNNALKAQAPTIAEICDLTDNGVTVEVYVCPVDADYITDVVVTRTQLMKIKRVGTDTITLEDMEPDSRDPRQDSDLKKITGYNNFAIDVTEDYDSKNKNSYLADVKDSNYDAYNALKDMKAGDYVAVVPYTTDNGKTWEVGEAYAPETVSGAFTQVDTYANVNKREGSAIAITVGGTSYPINEWNKDMLNVTGNKIKATKKDVTLYLAKDGTALWADEIGNSDAWMVVGDYYQATSPNGKVDWFVHGWTIKGAEVDLDLGTIRGEAEIYAPGELVYYSIANTSNGEYQLSKPNNRLANNGFSLLNNSTNGTDGRKAEPAWKDKDGNYTGEGVYEVAQFSVDQTTGNNVKTRLTSRTGAVPLELYNRTELDAVYKLWSTTTDGTDVPAPAGDGTPQKVFDKELGSKYPPVNHDFKYRNIPYNDVKFIFVNFADNGEVETIDFRSGPQNVEYNDLITFNRAWRNNATHLDHFVVTAAEAYVNDKGEVKAVVVKTDSGEADLSKIAVITATDGDKYWNKNTISNLGAEGDRPAGMSYKHEYVCGPSFSMADAKVGVFDKWYEVGDILVITEKDGVISGKKFHAESFNNGNPDAVFVKGINAVLRPDGKDAGIGFTIGQKIADGAKYDSSVYTLKGEISGHELFYDKDKNGTWVTSNDKTIELLGNKYTVAYDTLDNNLKGLVTVDKNTTFVDLRPGEHDDIDSLSDLMDYDLDSLELRLLVNTKVESNTFRHAYAVIVEKAIKLDNAEWVDLTEADAYVDGVKITTDADKSAWKLSGPVNSTLTQQQTVTVKAAAGKDVTLRVTPKNSDKYGILSSVVWNGAGLPTGTATGNAITVKVPASGVATYVAKVTNTDTGRNDAKYTVTEVTFNVSKTDEGGVTPPTEGTWNLTLAGVLGTNATLVKANGAVVPATSSVPGTSMTYAIAKDAKVVISTDGTTEVTNANAGVYDVTSINGKTISVLLQDTANNDTITIEKLTDDLTLTMADAGAPNGGATADRMVSIKALDNIAGKWYASGADATADKDGVALTEAGINVKAGGVVKFTDAGDGAVVIDSVVEAGTGTAGTDWWTDTGATATTGALNASVTFRSATKVIVDASSTGTTVQTTILAADDAQATAVATGFYLPVNKTYTVTTGSGFDGSFKAAASTTKHGAKCESFTLTGEDDVYITSGLKLDITGMTATVTTVASDTIANGEIVTGDVDLILNDKVNTVVVKNLAADADCKKAETDTAGTITGVTLAQGDKFVALTKVTLNMVASAATISKGSVDAMNQPTLTVIATQDATAGGTIFGFKPMTVRATAVGKTATKVTCTIDGTATDSVLKNNDGDLYLIATIADKAVSLTYTA